MFNRTIATIGTAVAVVLIALVAILPAAAQQGPSATRSLPTATVAPGGEVTVTVAFANVGATAAITETLPAGFTYVDSSLDDTNVRVTDQEVKFNLFEVTSPFTYTVTASDTADSYDFSGTLRVGPGMDDAVVGGDTSVTVEAAARSDSYAGSAYRYARARPECHADL